MAEIKIEKKIILWPWILAGIGIIALLLVYFFNYRDKETTQLTANNTDGKVHESIVAYTNYADSDTTAMALDHEYTHIALMKLAEATQNLADNYDYQAKADIEKVKECAEQITIDPNVGTHANNIKQAAGLLSSILSNIQNANFPDLGDEAEEVRMSVEGIDTDELTLDQKSRVKAFFNNASVLLKKMDQSKTKY